MDMQKTNNYDEFLETMDDYINSEEFANTMEIMKDMDNICNLEVDGAIVDYVSEYMPDNSMVINGYINSYINDIDNEIKAIADEYGLDMTEVQELQGLIGQVKKNAISYEVAEKIYMYGDINSAEEYLRQEEEQRQQAEEIERQQVEEREKELTPEELQRYADMCDDARNAVFAAAVLVTAYDKLIEKENENEKENNIVNDLDKEKSVEDEAQIYKEVKKEVIKDDGFEL